MTRSRATLAAGVVVALLTGTFVARGRSVASTPTLHYAPNHNFDPHGHFMPAEFGFDLADVSSVQMLSVLPPGIKGLAWVGGCPGASASFVAGLKPYHGHPNLFGFYLADDPDPRRECPPARLRAEADWVHEHFPGAITFITMEDLARSPHPSYRDSYNPANSHVDLYGIAPYPCRTERRGCDTSMIASFVAAAEAAGIPRARIVPVFQAFGGGAWMDDGAGTYTLPTPAEAEAILADWRKLVPHPVFDMTYSWGSQQGDVGLADAPSDLRMVFEHHNKQEVK